MESVLYDDDVRSGHTTDTIRVPDQKVHNYRSDRWIALKSFSRVSGDCFTYSKWKRFAPPTTLSGWSLPPTRPEYRIKRSINIDPTVGSLLNCFHEFSEAVLHGVAWNRFGTPTTLSGRRIPPTRPEYRIKRFYNYRSDRCIALKWFSRVSGGWFTWSSRVST